MYKILIADSDKSLLGRTTNFLQQAEYTIYTARNAGEVLEQLAVAVPDLFLIDMMLPGANGFNLCRILRSNPKTAKVPILFLMSQESQYSAADALKAGGDDVIRKPFAVRELLARIRANLRWLSTTVKEIPAIIRISPATYQVFINDREVSLTRVEFNLLSYMCQDPQKWHRTQELLEHVWHYPGGVGDTALVRNHIRNLRRKLEDNPDRPTIIQSRHGRGYAVRAQVQFGSAAASH